MTYSPSAKARGGCIIIRADRDLQQAYLMTPRCYIRENEENKTKNRMHMQKLIQITLIFSLFMSFAAAQTYTETGSQIVTNYSPKEYNASGQNWSIAQDSTGIMYFGNWLGLLEFDGAFWRLHKLPNKSAVLSLAIAENGKIYTGGIGELGYFFSGNTGKLTFHSLLRFLPEDKREFSNIWQTLVCNGKVYFFSGNYIFIWNEPEKEFEIIQAGNSFHTMFLANGSLYVREREKGLKILKDSSLTLLNDGEKFANEKVFVLLPFPNEEETILIGTRTMGFFKYNGKSFIPFKTEADEFIEENLIYLGVLLSDGNILTGTLNGGAVLLEPDGRVVRKYNLGNGIINNNIYSAFQDRSGAIWLATDNGISRIDYASPITYFDSRNNFSTIPFNTIRHNGILYVAATTGFFYLDSRTSDLQKLENIAKQSWTFLEYGDDLLAGTNDGLFIVDNKKAVPIRKKNEIEYRVYVLKQSQLNPKRIFVGADDGLFTKLKTANGWIDEARILENVDQKNSIIEDNDGKIWVGTVSSGIFRITLKKDEKGNLTTNNPVIDHFDETNGLQSGQISVDKINGTNYFFSLDSIFKFDESKKIFFSDTSDKIISDFYNLANKKLVILFQQDSFGRLWLARHGKVAMGTLQQDNSYKWISAPFNRFADEEIYNIYAEKNGIVWFCTSAGIIKYDFSKSNLNKDYYTLVRDVQVGADSTIYSGGELSNSVIPDISFKNNSIKFRFSASSYEGRNTNRFRTFLEGFDDGWSSWSSENKKEYTNLPPGQYIFNVTSENILGMEGKTGKYSFEILPPWYRTWWAYSVFILLSGLLVFVIDRVQRRRLISKERERAENERKTLELEEARKLQLSMLPKDVPRFSDFDIAVYMQTATEVGGDYYDFSRNKDGSLNICLGDATGHGLKAGIIVSMMKSLFIANSVSKNLEEFFATSNNAIKDSKLDRMMMAFGMLNLHSNKIRVANAGIPPVYIYRKEKAYIEEIGVNGMPLGAMKNSTFEVYENTLVPGDTILMLSDGFPELQNNEDEMYGYERLTEEFSKCGHKSSEEIISYLKGEISRWARTDGPDDDVTFVVIKVQ